MVGTEEPADQLLSLLLLSGLLRGVPGEFGSAGNVVPGATPGGHVNCLGGYIHLSSAYYSFQNPVSGEERGGGGKG